ncbi:hypothetical protein [Ruminococcus sp.]|uniref:hypothetical protein n=1 Tax=Ruminococcus sp. TaxID=41978 RepID=UPI001B60D6E6|nr:hypothetical protein [Ruminococcus sp.]MBP5433591.1 hypothetical protein [Ruminococcus sp.]
MNYVDLKPGDFAMPVPVGLQLTVQYNTEGSIEKVYSGYHDRTDITSDIVGILIAKKTLPAKISARDCTTWVFGVLYTSRDISKTAALSGGTDTELLKIYTQEPAAFNFFAASYENSIGAVRGSVAVRRALAMNGFKMLPGWDIFTQFNEKLLSLWLKEDKYTFKPVVTDIVALGREAGIKYIRFLVNQIVVSKVHNYIDNNGFLRSRITADSGTLYDVNYADSVSNGVAKGSVVYFNERTELLYSSTKVNAKQAEPVKCRYCGKLIEIPKSGTAQCGNPHCASRLVSCIRTFTDRLGMPQISNETLREYVDKQKLTCLPDIFLLDEYKGNDVNTSAANLLRALIPYDVIARDDVLLLFTTACMENTKTIVFYMSNPEQIQNDLRITHADLPALIEWFSDPCNVSDMTTLLATEEIKIAETNKKFDGAPIFRDKIIFITGTFLHGSLGYVSSILQSYAAKVTTIMSNNVDCVLVGGTHENIDGAGVASARAMHKPIMEELDFFKAYGIDEDINNLV